MEKKFSFESAKTEEQQDYHTRILSIINELEQKVRLVVPDSALNRELHEKKKIDAHTEIAEFEPVRRDICESFGISYDPEHIYLYDEVALPEARIQRALRAFFVMIDTVTKDGFYGEGRIDHNTILNRLIALAKRRDPAYTFESVIDKVNTEPPQILVFKGFLSTKEFKELSEKGREVIETPLFDKDGKKIETAEEWFLTGHNLEGISPRLQTKS